MQCPKCGADHNFIETVDSRPIGNIRWRRKKCIKCGHKFNTYETTISPKILFTKKDIIKSIFDELNKLQSKYEKYYAK